MTKEFGIIRPAFKAGLMIALGGQTSDFEKPSELLRISVVFLFSAYGQKCPTLKKENRYFCEGRFFEIWVEDGIIRPAFKAGLMIAGRRAIRFQKTSHAAHVNRFSFFSLMDLTSNAIKKENRYFYEDRFFEIWVEDGI
jgi:hypothetical protein